MGRAAEIDAGADAVGLLDHLPEHGFGRPPAPVAISLGLRGQEHCN